MILGKTHSRLFIAAAVGVALFAGPLMGSAQAQSSKSVGGEIVKVLGGNKKRQGEKNAMRNLGIGLGGAAAYEGINGRGTHALILGAGAALAGKKYEDARKAQNRENEDHRSSSYWKKYRYDGKTRIGYYQYKGNKKVAYYKRLRDSDGDWRNSYARVQDY